MSEQELRTEDIATSDPAPGEGVVEHPDTAATPLDALLPEQEQEDFMRRWKDIQAAFVDDPRQALTQADALVAGLMQRLAAMFSEARSQLEEQWDRGDEVSTEDQRVILQRYRSFFTRLLRA